MSFQEKLREDQRLVILRFLSEVHDYRLNASLLQDALDSMGHQISRDLVLAHINWLEEQGLVRQEKGQFDVVVVTILERGLDVAEGRVSHPGVKRRRPTLG